MKESTLLWFVFLIVWPAGLIAGEDRGRPTCDYCRMIITEKEYGGRIKTVKGKALIFDATECMAAYVIKAMVKPAEIQSLWSMHFSQPGRMVNAKTAFYLQSNSMMSPMSINLSAYRSRAEAERMRETILARSSTGLKFLDHVKQKWFREMLAGPRR